MLIILLQLEIIEKFKNIVKFVFVIFTFTLCVFIFILNNNCGISSSDKEKHKPSPTPVLFASIFIALIGLVMIYLIILL